jgi:beta-N-acetylhexosaminidase
MQGGAAIDALLDGLRKAAEDGTWHPNPDSDARRLDLLPSTPPLPWDELMHQPMYQHALERLP